MRLVRLVAAGQQGDAPSYRRRAGPRPMGVARRAGRAFSERGVGAETDPRSSGPRSREQLLLRDCASDRDGHLPRLAVASSPRSLSGLAQHCRDLHRHCLAHRDDSGCAAAADRSHRAGRYGDPLWPERLCPAWQWLRRRIRGAAVDPRRLGVDHCDRLLHVQHEPVALDRCRTRRTHGVCRCRHREPLLVRRRRSGRRTRLRVAAREVARSSTARFRGAGSGSWSCHTCATTSGDATGCRSRRCRRAPGRGSRT